MRRIVGLVVALGFTTSLTFCSSGSEKTEASKPEREAPKMYVQSELAALMHEVHDLSAKWKTELENGEELTPVPDWVQDMLTADATSPDELASGPFEALAQEYLRNLEKLVSAENEGRVDAFNTAISTCISCHKVYCNGPIPKIEKLRI
jgi:hypothetical protein